MELIDRVRHAIEESRDARDAFSRHMEEVSEQLGYSDPSERSDDKQVFGSPATAEAIDGLETELGRVLPPSYRAFLLIHDGWKVVDGSQSFLSIDGVLAWRGNNAADWMSIASDAGLGVVRDCLVVGASTGSSDKYLMNPNEQDANGEWQFIEYNKDGMEVFPSFFAFLVDSKRQFEEARQDLSLDDYFDPFDFME